MINLKLIDNAIGFYQEHGFKRIETPWLVPDEINKITQPNFVKSYHIPNFDKSLVGSGEQSFLYLLSKHQLPTGKYQTLTPCFRDEIEDLTHFTQFMKLELIDTQDTSEPNLLNIISYAETFFNSVLNKKTEIIKTDIGYDIMFNNIELGSYGIRKHEYLSWIYATGIAEPRLSNLIKSL